ncbi:hypothetical protein ACOME3_003194 [Neoechinorhynchus agilis]
MRPICLRGHTRPITKVAYNSDGDLTFSSSKDGIISVWYTISGERLGTYDMDRVAAVWSFDVDYSSRYLTSATAAPSLILYDVETGRRLHTTECESSVRSCSFSYCGNLVAYSTDRMMGYECRLGIMDVRTPRSENSWEATLASDIAKVNCSLWGTLDRSLITAHHDGSMRQWDLRAGDAGNNVN